jgi:integrase
MSATIRPWVVRKRIPDPSGKKRMLVATVQKGFEVDIRVELPDGTAFRERRKSPVPSRSGSQKWAEARERHLYDLVALGRLPGKEEEEKKEIPTLAEFAKRFIDGYAKVENKASEVTAKQSVLDHHLVPRFGSKRLDEITTEDVDGLKANLLEKKRSPKTVNNVLTVLRRLLQVAKQWEVIETIRPHIRQLKQPVPPVRFYEREELDLLIDAAGRVDERAHVIVLIGADAGLRLGEMLALERSDLDFRREKIRVERSEWHGVVGVPKNYRTRTVPMTDALRQHRHLRSERILCQDDGTPLDRNTVKRWMVSAQRRANLRDTGAVHILRHTFCTRLAARNVPPRTIMELAGHRSLSTTMRYMHVCSGAPEAAIKLLDQPEAVQSRGELLENTSTEIGKVP